MGDGKVLAPEMSTEEISKIPLPSTPYPYSSVSSSSPDGHNVSEKKNSPSCNFSSFTATDQTISHSIERNEQCYELLQSVKQPINSNTCYEISVGKNVLLHDVNVSEIKCLPGNIMKDALNTPHRCEPSNSEKNSFVLKSSENFHRSYNSECEENLEMDKVLKNHDGLHKIFESPISKLSGNIQIKPVSSPKSLKRSHLLCDDNSEDGDSFLSKRFSDHYHRYSNSPLLPSPSPFSFNLRSLPKSAFSFSPTEIYSTITTPDKSVRRKSYPVEKLSSLSSTPRSTYRSCITDQTPYAEDNCTQNRKRFKTLLPYYNAFDLISLKSEVGFIDSHCHLDFLFQRQGYFGTYTDYQKNHESTFPKCYQGCLAIFCNPFTFNQEYMWGKFLKEENVWASFGCHPHNAKDYNDEIERSLCAALKHSKVRAVGEIGLDYSNRNNCLKDKQFEAFRRQLKIALKVELPVVIHCREAHEDGIAIIKEILPKDYTIHLHCFTDTWEWAQKWLEEFPNLFIGITNVVTFPSAESVHEVAKNIPLSRLLLETDAPYFIPRRVAKETKFSHPGMAIHVAAQIAALRNISLEEVLQCTRKNTTRMYNI